MNSVGFFSYFCPLYVYYIYARNRLYTNTLDCLEKHMKMTTYKLGRLFAATAALLTLAFCCMPQGVQAQEGYYTLTNGRLWWYEGADGVGHKTERAVDKNNGSSDIHRYDANNVTLITDMGAVYMALDLSDPDHPALTAVDTADFNPYCVWQRTGSTGYYYQAWGDYRYYVVGSPRGITLAKIKIGDPVDNVSYWYNWDYGAAITDVTYRDGKRKESFHWIMYDSEQANPPVWRISNDSYQRPEDAQYDRRCEVTETVEGSDPPRDTTYVKGCSITSTGHPEADSIADIMWKSYYDNYAKPLDGGGHINVPAGNGALFMPVTPICHAKEIAAIDPAKGLNGVGIVYNESGETSLRYGQSVTATPTVDLDNGSGGVYQASVTQPYNEYRLEIYRYGIHEKYGQRETETFGSAGIPTYRTIYYYSDDHSNPTSNFTRHTVPPTPYNEDLEIAKVTYSLNNPARRYLSLSVTESATVVPVTINCVSVPLASAEAKLTVTVTYTNGTSESITTNIAMSNRVDRREMPLAENAPVVTGYVVGGGRMANVGGDTRVTVHASDSIYALYGGNDIAGWVQGDNGSTIAIGSSQTDADHQVHIGYVYGGGCGFYTYRGINFGHDIATNSYVYPYDYGKTSLMYQSYYFNGEVYPWLYEPTLSPTAPAGTPHVPVIPADTAYLVWDPADRVVSNQFVYNPLYSDPNDVDNNETGDNGNGTVPYIKKANITVGVAGYAGNDYIRIDTLFGGAENAFIGVQTAGVGATHDATNITINGGTIFAVFGGNNYGGSIAHTATTNITVRNTKLAPKPGDAGYDAFKTSFDASTGLSYTGYALENTYFRGYGRDYGIRYLYGGGNMVKSEFANVTIIGGMIDTCFLGGNRATVDRPVGAIYCTGDNFIYENDSITREWVWKAAGTYDGMSHVAGQVVQHPEPWTLGNLVELSAHRKMYDASNTGHEWQWYDSLRYHTPGRFAGDIGRYNVRVLFGGNNNAPMYDISRINLMAGGVGSVYGGGNAGDMRSMRPISDVPDMASRTAYAMKGWLYQWPEVFSAFVHSPGPNLAMESNLSPGHSSRIICEYVYGGCRKANVKGSTGVWLSGGVFGYVNGGNDISGDVGTETGEGSYVVLDGDVLVMGDVYGGSDGYYHCQKTYNEPGHKGIRYMDGGDTLTDYNGMPYDRYDEFVDELVPTQNSSNLYIHANVDGYQPTVLFAAYGGGVMTNVGFEESGNNRIMLRDSIGFTGTGANGLEYTNGERELRLPGGSAGNKRGSVHFQMNGGTVGSVLHHGHSHGEGNAYGGGYLSSIYGLSYTYIHGTSTITGSLYAGNDCMGSIASFGAYSIPEVRDNLNGAGDTLVHQSWGYDEFAASDGTLLNQFDGSSWNAAYSAYLRIEDTPRINCVYGSGNGAYDYDGTRPEYSSTEPVCQQEATENRPLQASTFIDLNVSTGAQIDTVFGGGNGVGVRDNVLVLLNCTESSVAGVGTIFGGNNRDDMNTCVPDIILKKGVVDYVFGGGNAGNMNAKQEFTDTCGNIIDSVSTYVQVNDQNVTITEAIFGGCRKADVKYKAYIDIRNSHTNGINYVYGGNDISGTVKGGTRIDVSGGVVKHIYGGSNGHYDYEQIASNNFTVFPYNSDHSDTIAKGTTGIPFVDKTVVNLWGGEIDNHVYGGGRLGDCRLTNVIVNDMVCPSKITTPSLVINGSVYGGGEGIYEDLDKPHRGNVVSTSDGTGYTNVELHHATSLSTARAYGGGRGGDVENTYIEAFDTWDQPFDAIYGGCWGSTVFGSTNVTMRGNTTGSSMTADSVFGGNDFTGYVHQSNINIMSGRYGNIYGAGNGNYPDAQYTAAPYNGTFANGDSKRIYPPNTFRTSVNFVDGIVTNNIYGGGMLGTCIPYVTNDQMELVPDVNGRYVADTLRSLTTPGNLPHTDANKYSRAIVNILGGNVLNNIYAGAAGQAGGKSLIYGLKEVNMQGGAVNDLYGGSENVSDGYYHECVSKTNTTLRPSSIINISGGNIRINVYGGGYLGNVFGSGYINVGLDAIDSCEVWTSVINEVEGAYASFKPGANGIAPAMTTKDLMIAGSIYGGANWGENSGNADYTVPGYFGGKNRITIDGERYNTYLDEHSTLPKMDIMKNVIGSGTSASGGDVQSRIDVRNYGALGSECVPGKTLLSIQRASSLWLHNTAINFEGYYDATSAYVSRMFTIMNVDTLNTMGYNVISLQKTATNIKLVNYYKEGWPLVHTKNFEFPHCWGSDHCRACNDDASVCDQLSVLDRNVPERMLPAFLLHQGINIDFMWTDNSQVEHYAELFGFAYLAAAPGTNAVVTASPKYGSVGEANGGFMSSCTDSLKTITSYSGPTLFWDKPDASEINKAEYPYYNYSTSYRVWSIGNGLRTRFAVVQAHSDPTKLAEMCRDFSKIYPTGGTETVNMSIARSTLKLPPTTPGNFYKINSGIGVVLDDENEEMRLTGEAFMPSSDWEAVNYDGRWVGDNTRAATMVNENPGNYFGLLVSSGANFKRDNVTNEVVPPLSVTGAWDSCTTISGNEYVNAWSAFSSAQVGADVNALPELDLYMIYDKSFSHTLIGTVTFTLDEYKAVQVRANYNGTDITTNSGALTTAAAWNAAHAAEIAANPSLELQTNYLDSNLNIPIRVQITITTIMNDFRDMAYDVLAMYNEGRNNMFSRKMVLPATLESRELYLEKIEWAPTVIKNSSENGNGVWFTSAVSPEPDDFYLTSDTMSILTAADGVNNLFGMSIMPAENVTNTMTSGEGWHERNVLTPLDLVSTAGKPTTGSFSTSDGTYITHDSDPSGHQGVDLTANGTRPGIKLGLLDGHSEAALDVNLHYDGDRMYKKVPGRGYIGKAVLTLRSYYGSPGTQGAIEHDAFTITIFVKTRDIGDTIYVASTRHIPERGGITLPEGHNMKYYTDSLAVPMTAAEMRTEIGKSPSKYLTNIKDAFDERIYQEGDVICILDQVNITAGEPLLIKGHDYMRVPVMRYDGHHHEFPGEACVYRGTMINVAEPNASFSARFIDFNGGFLSKIEPNPTNETGYNSSTYEWTDHPVLYNPIVEYNEYDNVPGSQKYADTNKVFGPVIAVSNGGTVALQNGVVIEQNYNGYTGGDKSKYGAVNVTNGGNLTMINGVTLKNNLSDTIGDPNDVEWRIHPQNGALYVDGGKIELLNSNTSTAMDITKNFVAGSIGGTDLTNRFWDDHTKTVKVDGSGTMESRLTRYDFDNTSTSNTPANVLLARQPDLTATDPDMKDSQTEVIVFSTTIPTGTKIGISKWFPDEDEEKRDTIQIVYQAAGSHLDEAIRNNNFLSDNGFFVMHNQGINVQRIYLQRCATFKHQVASTTPLIDGILPKDVLDYNYLANVNCPVGGDSIIYRIQGGFFPYTYNWSWTGGNSVEHVTEYTSNEIMQQTNQLHYDGYRAAIADTLVTTDVTLGTLEKKKNINFTVQATDATGNCHLQKNIDLTIAKSIEDDPVKFDVTKYDGAATDPTVNSWSDTNQTHHARATRNYKAVQIRPRVWADPYTGTIEAVAIIDGEYKLYYEDADHNGHGLDQVYLCEGEVINLTTLPKYDGSGDPMGQFVMWDFDPYYSPSAVYVVPAENRDVVAYYSPMTYWKDHIDEPVKAGVTYDNTYTYNSRPTVSGYTSNDGSHKAGYVTTYNGDVHIYDENGLAWFISVVNGLNGTQAREFFFNKVYLHQKSGGYNMKDYKWSPVGNRQHAFRGWFQGVSETESDTARLADGSYVEIHNLILNEPAMENVGMFGFLDSAHVSSISLQGVMARGNQNVGALAANSVHTKVTNTEVIGNDDVNTTILATHYVSGGMIGLSDHDAVTNSSVSAKYVGDAVYSGGVVGHGTSTRISNTGPIRNDNRMSGLYVGGVAGWLDGTAPVNAKFFRKGKSGDMSEVRNNYVQLVGDHKSQREGGLVGHSRNTIIENNYVFGKIDGSVTDGAIAAVLDNGSRAENNYHQSGSTENISGMTGSTASESNNTSFKGTGNQVMIDQHVYGVNNLTRVLNIWVNSRNEAEGSTVYKTWRSDLQGVNHGFPVYGNPDIIPVERQLTLENCDTVEWEGSFFTTDTTMSYNIIDSVQMVDSTTSLTIIVHHSTVTELSDSIGEGEGYSNYGFYLTPAETMLMQNTLERHNSVTIVLYDTLATEFGCDSVITLSLTITKNVGITEVTPTSEIKVFPNPTTSYVTVEATALKHVELYDNEGRRLADYVDAADNKLTINVDQLSTGVYFLRIHTGEKVTIQKLIKK